MPDVRPKFSDPSTNDKGKRKRQSQSCDACRARKVKCTRENPDDPCGRESLDDSKLPCKHCISNKIPCTYDYQPKKRGPRNLYVDRIHSARHDGAPDQDASFGSVSPQSLRPGQGNSSPSISSHSPYMSSLMSVSPTLAPSNAFQPSYPLIQPHPKPQYGPAPQTFPHNDPRVHRLSKSDGSSQHQPLTDFSNPMQAWPFRPPAVAADPSSSALYPLSFFNRPHRVDTIIARETLFHIINLFFVYVYPLMPCVHKPSFMADLHSRKEERDPLFFSLVMSIVASTLVQVPRSYVPIPRQAVRCLAQQCHEASRLVSLASYVNPGTTHVVIRYLDYVYHFHEGSSDAWHAAFGEALHLAVSLRMHEEISYEGCDPIDCEIRRRTFWLLFGADKLIAILHGCPISLREEECVVKLPEELHDDCITLGGYLPQPHGETPIVSGLNYVSSIFAILGEILARIRIDKRSPPQGHFATARLDEIGNLFTRLRSVCLHAPEPLRLNQSLARPQVYVEYSQTGYPTSAFAELEEFFGNPNAPRDFASNPFLVMQANIYVTQQLVKLVIGQHYNDLKSTLNIHSHQAALDKDTIATELSNILQNIPIQSIATNGIPLVHKVRYVEKMLLDGGAATARAHAYLWPFLVLLTEIENKYMPDDERMDVSRLL